MSNGAFAMVQGRRGLACSGSLHYLAPSATPDVSGFAHVAPQSANPPADPRSHQYAAHALMAKAIGNDIHSFAWRNDGRPGAQVGHAALTYMFHQAEGG